MKHSKDFTFPLVAFSLSLSLVSTVGTCFHRWVFYLHADTCEYTALVITDTSLMPWGVGLWIKNGAFWDINLSAI